MDDHRQFDSIFQIRGVTKDMINEIEKEMPGMFDYRLNRSVSDYIYTREKLIYLKGKSCKANGIISIALRRRTIGNINH